MTKPTIVEVTAFCDNCQIQITRTATSEAFKKELYEWISTRVLCDFCRKLTGV